MRSGTRCHVEKGGEGRTLKLKVLTVYPGLGIEKTIPGINKRSETTLESGHGTPTRRWRGRHEIGRAECSHKGVGRDTGEVTQRTT